MIPFLQLNASDERGIDVVRNQIKDFAGSRMWQKGLKLVILDEADAMTNVAQGALRRSKWNNNLFPNHSKIISKLISNLIVIEQYSKGTRFCLICNHINKIIPAIQSRCTRFRFAPLDAAAVRQCIERVSAAEHFTVTPDGVDALIRIGHGDMRRVLNVLQSTWLAYDVITKESIYEATGQPAPEDITRMLEFMSSLSLRDAVAKIEEIKIAKGLALQDIIAELLPFVLLMKIDKDAKMHIVSKLADVEANVAAGSSEKIQLGALVSAFQVLRLSA